jgi:hypothetical protein
MNYLSKPYDVQAPVEQGGNLQVAMGVLTNLQSKYDANKAIIDNTISQYESLRGLTDLDNEYIASQVSNIKNQVNKLGGLNLAHNTGRDTVLNNLKNVMKDPIVQGILVSKANKDNYDASYQEMIKKDPSKDSRDNYEYGLEQGGYFDYIQGKTKQVGGMQYKPFENVQANYTKRLKEYVEQYDDEQYIGTETGQYQTVDVYGKRVLKQDLENFLVATTDPKEAEQLTINAWSKYRGVKDTEISGIIKPVYQEERGTMKKQEAILKAKADSGDAISKQRLTTLKKSISELDTKINSNDFNKQDLYNYDKSTFISNMASLYDKDVITKRDKNNLPFEVLKFNTDTALKIRDIESKERANSLKEAENKMVKQSMGGDAVIRETPPEEQKLTGVQKAQKELNRTATAFDTYLSENIEGYDDMSESGKWDYKLHYNPTDPTIKGNKTRASVLSDEFQSSQKQYSDMVGDAEEFVAKAVKGSYNDMVGGSANLANLKATMPLTASTLQNKKGVEFQSLPNAVKSGLISEWTRNKLQYGSPASEDVRSMYAAIVVKNKAKLKEIKSDTAKEVLGHLKGFEDAEEASIVMPGAKAFGSLVKNLALDTGYDAIKYLKDVAVYGSDYAGREYGKSSDADWNDMKAVPKYWTQAVNGMTDKYGGGDTNLTELEPRDLRKGAKDIEKTFTDLDVAVADKITKTAASYQGNTKEYRAYNFSTENKMQENTAQKIRAALLDSDVPIPKDKNDYTISREGNNYRVSYMDKADKKQSELIGRLDESITGLIDEKKAEWLKDPANTKIYLKPSVIKPIMTPTDSFNKVNNFVDNIKEAGILSLEDLEQMKQNPGKTPLASVTDYITIIKNKYGKDFYNKNQQAIDEILVTEYKATPYSTGSAFKIKIDYVEKGKEYSEYPEVELPEKNSTVFYLNYLDAVGKLKDKRVNALKNE